MGDSSTAEAESSWEPHPEADARRQSAVRIAKLVLGAEGILPFHRNELLSIAIWKYTEADGKFRTRWRSRGALHERDLKLLNHEHVVPRKVLRDQMLREPERCEELMALAVGCVVTRDEHRLLNEVSRRDPALDGWDRYRAAGIDVFDMATGRLLEAAGI